LWLVVALNIPFSLSYLPRLLPACFTEGSSSPTLLTVRIAFLKKVFSIEIGIPCFVCVFIGLIGCNDISQRDYPKYVSIRTQGAEMSNDFSLNFLEDLPFQIFVFIESDKYGIVNQKHSDFIGKAKKDLEYANIFETLPNDLALLLEGFRPNSKYKYDKPALVSSRKPYVQLKRATMVLAHAYIFRD